MGYTQKLGLLAQSVFQDSSLNVGIGGSPSGSYKLEVTGTAGINSTVAGYGLTLTNIQDSSQGLLVRATDNDTSLNILNLQSSVGATSQTWVDRFTVTKGGNVGINTTTPNIVGFTGPVLTVNGTGNYQGFEVATSGTSRMVMISNGTDGYISTRQSGMNLIFETGSASEKMRIDSAGTVTISSNIAGDPTYLVVRNTNTGGYPSSLALSLYGYAVAAAYYEPLRIQSSYPGYGTTNFYVKYQPNSTAVSALALRGDGIVFLPGTLSYTTSASANLNMGAAGDIRYSTASSQRYKDNIEDWSGNGLNTILALKPRTFNYKESYYSNPNVQMLGLIAEEVAEVSPFLADFENEDRTGQVENVRYANIVVPLIKSIQELNERLNKAGL